MYNIDEIMDMLDWNNPEEIQAKGRELAKNIRCINVFLQPGHKGHKKNVWDNCALILSERTDEELRPYTQQLCDWLLDLNWPGAFCIWDRLMNFKDKNRLLSSIETSISHAQARKEPEGSLIKFKNEYLSSNNTRCLSYLTCDASAIPSKEFSAEEFRMKKAIGIVVQDVNRSVPLELTNISYNGLSKYYSFTADCDHPSESRNCLLKKFKRIIREDSKGRVSFISSFPDYIEYMEECKRQNISTRTLFLFTDMGDVLWEDCVPMGEFLGYEFAYGSYSDPQFISILDTAPDLEPFRKQLNANGLFSDRKTAEEFGSFLYSAFPWLEEEMAYSETHVFEVWEIKQFDQNVEFRDRRSGQSNL